MGKPDKPPGKPDSPPGKPEEPPVEPIPPDPVEPPGEVEPPGDGTVECPREMMDTAYVEPTGRTIEAGGDLQGALVEAQGGDQVMLSSGTSTTLLVVEKGGEKIGEGKESTTNVGGKDPVTGHQSPATAVVDGICECGHYESEHMPACIHLVLGCECEGYKRREEEKGSGGRD